jgi:hypothetical protein
MHHPPLKGLYSSLLDVARGIKIRSSDFEMNDFDAICFESGRFLKDLPDTRKGNFSHSGCDAI